MFYVIFEFLKLEKMKQSSLSTTPSRPIIQIDDYDEDSDDNEGSFRTSLSNSRVSKFSNDDDNNNDSNVTPTLNGSVPRITPELKLVNSTPLNHYNSQNGLSNRKLRRDLTRLG